MTEVVVDKSERFVTSSENELVDVMREYNKYLRPDSFYDQISRGGKITIIALILLANFLMMLITSLGGLV